MRGKLSFASVLLFLALAYAASPYVALIRLHAALERGDSAYLEDRVDWRAVRDGVKQDISDGVIGPLIRPAAGNGLPEFGASFMAGIAANIVDQDVTSSNTVEVMRQIHAAEQVAPPQATRFTNPFGCFDRAFFNGPGSFTVTVRPDDAMDGHLRLRLELHKGQWTVMRVWVPQDIVDRAAQRA